MPFTLIKGTFHAAGYQPDGDSIRFKADNKNNWKKIKGTPKLNKKEHTQLRIEAIDALETHYLVKGKGFLEQPRPLNYVARDFLLKTLGITNPIFGPTNKVVVSCNDNTPGYILTRTIDKPQYGRPVAFVFAGKPPKPDGSQIYLDAILLKKSLNYKLAEAGLAYPTYYKGFFYLLRIGLTKAVLDARKYKRGIWAAGKDKTNSGFDFNGWDTLEKDAVMFPKLFRRLAEFRGLGGNIADFKKFLDKKKDGLWVVSLGHHTDAMDFVIDVKGKNVKMKYKPEDIAFD